MTVTGKAQQALGLQTSHAQVPRKKQEQVSPQHGYPTASDPNTGQPRPAGWQGL